MTVSDLLEQPCYKSDNTDITIKLVTSCLYQFVSNLLTTWDKQCELSLLTADLLILQDVKFKNFACVRTSKLRKFAYKLLLVLNLDQGIRY